MTGAAVVTGLGTLGAWGAGRTGLRAALTRGELPLSEVDRSQGVHLEQSARRAALVPPGTYDPWLAPREARRMSPASRMAVVAARIALEEARLAPEDVAGEHTAISLGTAFGCVSYMSRLLDQAAELGPQGMSPALFTESVANVPAGQVALALEARGANYTVMQREASALTAVARGVAQLGRRGVRMVLAGAVDEMGPVLHAVLDRFGSLARKDGDCGFLAAEGATVLVLEEEDAARARGAPLVARVRAVARASDPTASTAGWGSGHEALARRLVAGLTRCDVPLASIDRVVSGASGSVRGDGLEAATLRSAFGDAMPPVLAPKAIVGEYGGNFLAAALLSLETESGWPGTAFGFARDGFAPSDPPALPPADRMLVTSLAAGGAAVWLVLERVA